MNATTRNCRNVRPVIVFTSQALIPTRSKERLTVMSTPNVIYRFTCTVCQKQYIGMTQRRLEDRVKEHMPKFLQCNSDKPIRSSITEHIIAEGHSCQRDDCFEILYKVRERRMLKFLEALAIHKHHPSLNTQMKFDYQVKLPWHWLSSDPFPPFSHCLFHFWPLCYCLFNPIYNILSY